MKILFFFLVCSFLLVDKTDSLANRAFRRRPARPIRCNTSAVLLTKLRCPCVGKSGLQCSPESNSFCINNVCQCRPSFYVNPKNPDVCIPRLIISAILAPGSAAMVQCPFQNGSPTGVQLEAHNLNGPLRCVIRPFTAAGLPLLRLDSQLNIVSTGQRAATSVVTFIISCSDDGSSASTSFTISNLDGSACFTVAPSVATSTVACPIVNGAETGISIVTAGPVTALTCSFSPSTVDGRPLFALDTDGMVVSTGIILDTAEALFTATCQNGAGQTATTTFTVGNLDGAGCFFVAPSVATSTIACPIQDGAATGISIVTEGPVTALTCSFSPLTMDGRPLFALDADGMVVSTGIIVEGTAEALITATCQNGAGLTATTTFTVGNLDGSGCLQISAAPLPGTVLCSIPDVGYPTGIFISGTNAILPVECTVGDGTLYTVDASFAVVATGATVPNGLSTYTVSCTDSNTPPQTATTDITIDVTYLTTTAVQQTVTTCADNVQTSNSGYIVQILTGVTTPEDCVITTNGVVSSVLGVNANFEVIYNSDPTNIQTVNPYQVTCEDPCGNAVVTQDFRVPCQDEPDP